MDSPILALVTGFIAMVFVMISYFVKQKNLYLIFQSCCIVFLVLSYFFSVQFFAMVGLTIGLARALTFFALEQKDKDAPIWLSLLFGGATALSYVLINLVILKDAKPLDLLCLTASVLYAFIFRIRDLKTVRFTMLIPTVLSIFYNTLTDAALFVSLSYTFELGANVVSIFRYHILPSRKKEEGKVAQDKAQDRVQEKMQENEREETQRTA